MALIADGGGGGPTLNPKAKHFERELFKVFSSSTSTIWLTQEDWRGAKTRLEDLAKDVQKVRSELQAPSDGGKGWQGPAAEAALSSLEKLSSTLEGHAAKVGDVDISLGQVYKAISDAKTGWYSEVASISTYVDPADHTKPAPGMPALPGTPITVPDPEAAAAAEDALWEERNQKAKGVLERLRSDTQTATVKMPIETRTKSETPYSPTGPGPGPGQYPTSTTTSSGGGGYQVGGPVRSGLQVDPGDGGDGSGGEEIPVREPVDPIVVICDPPETGNVDPHELDPISSDGETTGTTGLTPGPTTSASSAAGGGGGGGLGVGGVAAGGAGVGAAGLGGLLGARGGVLGARGGGIPGARGPGMVPGSSTQGRGTAAGGRGTNGAALRSGGAPARPGQVVPGGGQGRAATSSSRTSSVKGASGSGRYGVPRLDGKGPAVPGSGQAAKGGARSGAGGRGPAARTGAAGRSGVAAAAGGSGSRKGDRDTSKDVEGLTHEDEETWYDGTEDASPQVWE